MLRRADPISPRDDRFSTSRLPQFLAEKIPAAVQSGAHRADRTTTQRSSSFAPGLRRWIRLANDSVA